MERSTEPAEQAVARLYHDYYQPIVRYLERIAGSRDLAEDLAQETFVKALRHWGQLVSAEGAPAWLFRIARHTAYDHHRRRRRSLSIPLTESLLERMQAPPPDATAEEREPIERALSSLPDHYRTPLVLHSYAGYPLEMIAEVLGWKLGTVKSRLSRARVAFRRHYVA